MENIETLLSALSDIARDMHNRHLLADAQSIRERLRNENLNLVVLGQFKRGKTTVINALLGERVLPSSVVPLTSIVTKLVYGSDRGAEVIYYGSNKPEHVPIERICEFVTEKENPKNTKGVDFVRVGYPSGYLKQGIVLIDTPGIGSTFEHNTAAAYDFLPQMDAGIFVISVDPPLGDAEYRYLDSIKAYIDKIFFLLNKIDTMSEQEYRESLHFTKSWIEKKLSLQEVKVFPVSAKQALEAKISKDTLLYERSGFRTFEDALGHFIKKDKLRTLSASSKNKAMNLSKELLMDIQLTVRAVQSPVDELKSKIAILGRKIGEIEQRHREMVVLLEAEVKSLKQDIEQDIESLQSTASGTLKQGIRGTSFKGRSKREMVDFLNAYMKQGIEDTFGPWFKTEEQKASDAISRILMNYAKTVEEEINAVQQTAASLFDITAAVYDDLTELDPFSRLWYKVDDIIAWGIDNVPLVLPKLLFNSYIMKQTASRINEELDRNSGRARYDLFRRIDNTVERFRDALQERKSAVTDGIFLSVTKARELKSASEPEVHARLKVLNAHRELLTRLTAEESPVSSGPYSLLPR